MNAVAHTSEPYPVENLGQKGVGPLDVGHLYDAHTHVFGDHEWAVTTIPTVCVGRIHTNEVMQVQLHTHGHSTTCGV